MADSFVRVPADSVGKRVDATSLDVGADTVYRQRIVIGDNSATAQFAVVTGGALVVTGTMNISAMPSVNVNGGVAISGTAVVAGNVNISATAIVAGNVNISTMPAVVLAAGAANIGSINHISRTVTVVGVVSFAAGTILDSISATVGVKGQVSLGPGTSNIGTINNISATLAVTGTVALAAGSVINNISATVVVSGNVVISATATTRLAAVSDLTSGAAVVVGDSANSAIRVNVVAGGAGGGAVWVLDSAGGTQVNTGDSANSAIRVNIVAGGSPATFPAPTLTTGILTASASTANVSLSAVAGISVQLIGTWTGQMEFEVTTNNTDWFSHDLINITGNTPVNATTGNGLFLGAVGNFRQFRIRASALSVGTMSYAINTTFTTESMSVRVAGTATVVGVVSLAAGSILDSISATVGVKGQVSLAAGTSNIGIINNISATVAITGTVQLVAGTALIGDINAISRTVQVAIGTPFIVQGISTTVQVAVATPFIIQGISTSVTVVGNVNISTMPVVTVQGPIAAGASITAGNIPVLCGGASKRSVSATAFAIVNWLGPSGEQVAVLNRPAVYASASRGPKCVFCSTSAGVSLVSAPGAGNCVYVTSLMVTNGSATLTRGDVFQASATASCMAQAFLAASGGGFVMKYDPPFKVLSNTGLTCRVDPAVSDAIFNVHFYVGPK